MTKTVRHLQELTLHDIIGAPLQATVDADAQAAHAYLSILREYAFDRASRDEPLDFGALRMVAFNYVAPNERGQMETYTIKVPLLSLIPLPLIEVMEAHFDFNIRITGHSREVDATAAAARPWARGGGAGPVRLYALLAERGKGAPHDAPPPGATIGAKILLRRADLPAGVEKILNLLQHGIIKQSTELSVDVELPAPPPPGATSEHPDLEAAREEPA